MRAFLRFPEKYSVTSKLNLELFLGKASLTEKRKEYLTKWLSYLELCYIIRFKDGTEIPIYWVKMINSGCKYEEYSVVKFIAESMPYDCIILLQKANAVRLYFFESHANSQNDRRRLVEKYYKSNTLVYGKENTATVTFLKRLRELFAQAESKEYLYYEMQNILEEQTELGHENHLNYLRSLGLLFYNPIDNAEHIFPQEEISVLCEIFDDEIDHPVCEGHFSGYSAKEIHEESYDDFDWGLLE